MRQFKSSQYHKLWLLWLLMMIVFSNTMMKRGKDEHVESRISEVV
jgi:hypothetical protein